MPNPYSNRSVPRNETVQAKPMPFWQSLLYFGLPALLFRLCLYNGIPALMKAGLTAFQANVVAFVVPSAVLFALAFGFYRADGYVLRWQDIKIRFRLQRMTGRDWIWAVAALVLTFLTIGPIQQLTAMPLIRALPAIAPPDFFAPWLKPGTAFDLSLLANYIGEPLKGNWGVAALVLVMLFFNIFGEELWWRGYILPRQESVHGPWTWLINGFLWLLWHLAFYPWQAFALLPICLVVPFVAQRRQSTWVAIIIHLQNGVFQVLVLAMVLGLL